MFSIFRLYHPLFQVNNLTIQQLLERTGQKSLLKFLTSDLSGISPSVGKTLIERLGSTYSEDMSPSELNDKQITRLVQLLRSAGDLFKSPDGGCLSPLGEYNLNLGIKKVVEPDVIATARDKPGAYDGHPFIVEAAVSLGGKDAKEGITVVRFANRIPLLFEGGADVATRVANGKIKWATYKIDHKKDRIGVFVSIVSTKVPFKGTGKEYIGDDITEIQHSVKRAIQSCCQQLRAHLAKRNALRDVKERKSRLLKYIPDVSRSVFGLLDGMRKRRLEEGEGMTRIASPRKRVSEISPVMRSKTSEVEIASMINDLSEGILTEDTIKQRLVEAVEANANAGIGNDEDELGGKTKPEKDECDRQQLYLVPLYEDLKDMQHVIRHPLFDFFPMHIVSKKAYIDL
jgi:DNA topoisomerase-6 subunit B